MQQHNQLVTINHASQWATDYLKRDISKENIVYLTQYGKIKKYNRGGTTFVDMNELKQYYDLCYIKRDSKWKSKFGNDLNWSLSFDNFNEKDTTKHVHRLHPYKGKFIPQLVQYFLDGHIDEFKKQVYFRPGDIVLDPFLGSGTTIVQANEMGIHCIGIDVAQFNCIISLVKLYKYNLQSLEQEISNVQKLLSDFKYNINTYIFDSELSEQLNEFNKQHFSSYDFKYKVNQKEIDEQLYGVEKEKEFLDIYDNLIKKYGVELKQKNEDTFLDKWYCNNVRKEMEYVFGIIKNAPDIKNRQALEVILSRTIRSCRATTHFDLTTLKTPQFVPYYCWKHKKICRPIYSIKSLFNRYSNDTIKRLYVFDSLRTTAHSVVLSDDSRTVDIYTEVKNQNVEFYDLLKKQRIQGIFTSPPYIGQIDYHEQHAYVYELLGCERKDESEIGPLYKGRSVKSVKLYIDDISRVLLNCKKYLANNFDIFLVINDTLNIYPKIIENVGMYIVTKFKRPVLNRSERDKHLYSEYILHIKNRE